MSQSENVQLSEVLDPCAVDNPASKWAFVWTALVLIGGILLVGKLSKIDDWMYSNNAEYLDMEAYKENRQSQTSIKRDNLDSRRSLVTTLTNDTE